MLAEPRISLPYSKTMQAGLRQSPTIVVGSVDQDETDTRFSDSDIVPDEFQNRLMNLRDMMTACSWGIGDIANDLVEQNASVGIQVTDKRIHKAVGRFCGRSGRTVRYYAETASFFPQQVREEYDMLSFAHFVFARQMKELWREVLDYAASLPGATLEQLEKKYLPCQNTDTLDEQDSEQSREVSQFIDAAQALAGSEIIDTSVYTPSGAPVSSDSRRYGVMSAASALAVALSTFRSQAHELLDDQDGCDGVLNDADRLISELREVAGKVASIAASL